MYMNERAESESDFVKTKINDDYIKTFPPYAAAEDAADNNGSENDITIASRDDDDPGRVKV